MEQGNVTMGIWLGKQYLKQRDKHDVEQRKENKIIIVNDLKEVKDDNKN
jgi:hypothetical protein